MFTFIRYTVILLILSVIYGNVSCEEDRSVDFPKEISHTDEYVDPHSLYYDKHSRSDKRIESPHFKTQTYVQIKTFSDTKHRRIIEECVQREANNVVDELFARRLINIMLTRAKLDEGDHLVTGNLFLELTAPELIRLRNFGLGKATIRDIDPIISNIFKEPEKSMFFDTLSILKQIFLTIVTHKEIVATTLSIFYISWVVLRTEWNILKLVFIIFMLIIAASFIITWLQLLREAEIKLTVKQMLYTQFPAHCRPSQMSWWERLWSLFKSNEDCYRYYEARMENPFLAVTPGQAFTHMIGTCILQPAGMIGKAVNDFVDNATKHMWYPVRVIMGPIILLTMILAVIVALICMAGGTFNWGFGPFSLFSIGGLQKCCRRGCLAEKKREPVEVILNLKLEHKGETQEVRIDCVEQVPAATNADNRPKPDVKQIELPLKKNVLTDCDPAGGDANLPSVSTDPQPVNASIEKIERVVVNSGGGDN